MRRWTIAIKNILGRWKAERIRINQLRENYRVMEHNRTMLENGETI